MASTALQTTRRFRTAHAPALSKHVVVCCVMGVLYLPLGISGYLLATRTAFSDAHGITVFQLFDTNRFLSVVHLAIAASLLFAAWAGRVLARIVCVMIGLISLCLALLGVFLQDTPANLFALNTADTVLHFVTAMVLLGVAATRDARCVSQP